MFSMWFFKSLVMFQWKVTTPAAPPMSRRDLGPKHMIGVIWGLQGLSAILNQSILNLGPAQPPGRKKTRETGGGVFAELYIFFNI